MSSWLFVLLGGAGAVGAALAVGTIAAMVSYRRHGVLPGQDPSAPPPTAGAVRLLWVRIVIGVALAVAGVVALAQRGLLTGVPPG